MTQSDRTERNQGFLEPEDRFPSNESGERFVTFYCYKPPLTVGIGEQLLREAGVALDQDSLVGADVNPEATVPEEVQPRNLENAGILPSLDSIVLPRAYEV